MNELLSVFGAYDFAVRDALVLCLVAFAIYVLLSAGIFAVPQIGLMAVGAYVSAILSVDVGVAVPLAVTAGAVASGLTGLLLAGMLARLNGIYLAIASIAFSEVVRVAALNLPMTGGAQGKVGIPREVTDVWICGVVAIAAVGLVLLRRSRTGLAISAMRVDGMMAEHQGIDVVRIRTALFCLSGVLAGTAGALHVHMSGFVEPGQFNFELLTELLAVVVIGGMAYLGGTFVGAAVIFGLPFTLRAFADYQVLVNGLILIAVVAFAPSGIVGLIHHAWHSVRRTPSVPPGHRAATSNPRAVIDVTSTTAAGDEVLAVHDLSVTFGGVRALDQVAIHARAGEILGIIGPNGSGKTTLLNALSGAYGPSSGNGRLAEADLARLWGRPHRLASAGVARTFQNIRLMDTASSATNVALGVPPEMRHERRQRARDLLDRLGLAAIADTPTGELPYGLRRQVEIARALARKPRLLLLDEPTAGMSQTEREGVFDVVAELRNAGMAVVLVEHDVAMMRRFCDRLLVLNFGRTLAEGDPDEVLGSKEVVDAYIGSGART